MFTTLTVLLATDLGTDSTAGEFSPEDVNPASSPSWINLGVGIDSINVSSLFEDGFTLVTSRAPLVDAMGISVDPLTGTPGDGRGGDPLGAGLQYDPAMLRSYEGTVPGGINNAGVVPGLYHSDV